MVDQVLKKIMKMEAAEPFNTPVDPVSLGIPVSNFRISGVFIRSGIYREYEKLQIISRYKHR